MLVAGLAAGGAAVLLNAPGTAVVSVAALYAGVGYYMTRHPSMLWGSDRERPDWTAGAFAGGLSLGLIGLVSADVEPWLLLFGFGFVAFGFTTGVAYGCEASD